MTASTADLEGRWTVVTGASKGIGAAIAESYAAAGAHVLLVARDPAALEKAADGLRATARPGQEVRTVSADLSDRASLRGLLGVIDELPRLDVFVANVGSGILAPFLDLTEEQWDSLVELNLNGTFLAVQGAARTMRRADDGDRSIIVVSSVRALGARPGVAPYAATKAALNQLVKVAALELAPHGIRVNSLSPGITATPLSLEHNAELLRERTQDVPLGRAGLPSDMATAAVYLVDAAFVTGTNLVVDGGESLW